MRYLHQLTCVHAADLATVLELLDEQDFAVMRFDTTGATDSPGLLQALRREFVFPEGMEPANGDALADGLWNLVADREQERVALVWTGAQDVVGADLQAFLELLGVLDGLMQGTARGAPIGDTVQMVLVVAGTGAAFPGWDAR